MGLVSELVTMVAGIHINPAIGSTGTEGWLVSIYP